MQIRLVDSRLGLINSTTRLPFRYGKACLTRCPQAVLEVTIEVQGKSQVGYSGDCLPPSWFDKTPSKDYEQQIAELLATVSQSAAVFREELATPGRLFDGWLLAQRRIHAAAESRQQPGLLAGFGISMVERAIMDAMARAARISFAELVRQNLVGIDAGRVHTELASMTPRDWLPAKPRQSVYVRHTIGLADPLTESEIMPGDRVDDGYPQALEQYIHDLGVRYFKIKVSNQLETDLARLETIAAVVEHHLAVQYSVTLDGNEQYADPDDFDMLIERIQSNPRLQRLWRNTLLIEQPLPREIALRADQTEGIRRLSRQKAVIIDESDDQLDAYPRAIDVGYRGISSKNCKGPIRSLLNAGLTWKRNQASRASPFLMTGEDLCTVGVIPVQSDLCLVATLGLEHVERNGHHYHPGLSYLPLDQQQQALARHGDFYFQDRHAIRPRLVDGQFQIASLQCIGYGFDVLPNLADFQPSDRWEYASLGL